MGGRWGGREKSSQVLASSAALSCQHGLRCPFTGDGPSFLCRTGSPFPLFPPGLCRGSPLPGTMGSCARPSFAMHGEEPALRCSAWSRSLPRSLTHPHFPPTPRVLPWPSQCCWPPDCLQLGERKVWSGSVPCCRSVRTRAICFQNFGL